MAYLALCGLVFAIPFEGQTPLLSLPIQRITTVEAVWLVVMAVWIGALVRARTFPRWRSPVAGPAAALLAVLVVAALAAPGGPDARANALKAVLRLMAAGATAWMTATVVTGHRRMAGVLAVATVAGAGVATLAILEYLQWPAVLDWLEHFREGVRVVGGEVRASSTLAYPTIAAMYFELVFAGALGLLLAAVDRRDTRHLALVVFALALLAGGLALTFTRAGFLTVAASLLVAAWFRVSRYGVERGLAWLAVAGALVVVAPLVSWPAETASLRLTSEGRQGWYRATFDAPATIEAAPGALLVVPITVTNAGRLTWRPDADPPFRVSYHWVDAETTRIVQFDGARTPLPGAIAPGTSRRIDARVRMPRAAGQYRIAWDIVQEHRLWFSGEPGATMTFTAASVTGPLAANAVPEPPPSRRSPATLPEAVDVTGRRSLWRAAVAMIADHPWLGVGPDNFRWRYGAYLGLSRPDTRVHSNNQYLEILAGGGLAAGLCALWLLWRAGRLTHAIRRAANRQTLALYTGAAAAGAGWLVHGLVDSFLTFTPTYLAGAVVFGLIVAPAWWPQTSPTKQSA